MFLEIKIMEFLRGGEKMEMLFPHKSDYFWECNAHELDLTKELNQWLPSKIIDAHSHWGLKEHVGTINERILFPPASTFLYCNESMHAQANRMFYSSPVYQVAFGFPIKGIDVIAANNYVKQIAAANQRIIPFLLGMPLEDGVRYTLQELETLKFQGVKMYRSQYNSQPKRILEMYPQEILRTVEQMKIPIVLHLPTNLIVDAEELDCKIS